MNSNFYIRQRLALKARLSQTTRKEGEPGQLKKKILIHEKRGKGRKGVATRGEAG